MKKGFFISFEGSDGAGKSTQIAKVHEYLLSHSYNVVTTREPGGTAIGEKLRKIVLGNENVEMSFMTEALLYAASRAQHVHEVIKPALAEGKVVLCDRFVHSSIAYQGYARGLGADNVAKINSYAIDDTMPDVTFFIMLPTEIAMQRLKGAGKKLDRLEVEADDFFYRVEQGFMELERNDDRIIAIDATKSPEEMTIDILERLAEILADYERE